MNEAERFAYQPRATRCIEVWKTKIAASASTHLPSKDRWLKVYVVVANKELEIPDAVLTTAMKEAQSLEFPADALYGFLTLHFGTEAVWLLVDLWLGDILHHQVLRADLDSPEKFELIQGESILACVWELAVTNHERNAWVKHAMQEGEPNYEGYLADTFSSFGSRS